MIELKAVNNTNEKICLVHIEQTRKISAKEINEIKNYCEEELIKKNIVSIKYKIIDNESVIHSSNMLMCNIMKVDLILDKVIEEVNKAVKDTKVA